MSSARSPHGSGDAGSPTPPRTGLPPARLAYQRTSPGGYDLGLHADADVGTVEVGVCVEGGEQPTLGLSVAAPGVGRVTLGMLVDADGSLHLAGLTREHLGKAFTGAAIESEALQVRVAELELALARERAASAAALAGAADARAEAAAGDLEGLEGQIERLQAALQKARAEASAAAELRELAEDARAQAERELSLSHNDRAGLQRKLTERDVEQGDSEKRLAAAEAVREEAHGELERLRSAEERLESELAAQTRRAETAEADKASAEEAARTVSDELSRVRRQATGLQQSVDALTSELGTLRYAKQQLADQLHDYQEKSAAAEIEEAGQVRERDARIQSLERDVAAAQEVAESSSADALGKATEIQSLQAELEAGQARVTELEKSLGERDAQMERFRAEVLESSAQASAREAAALEQGAELERRLAVESERATGYESSYGHASERVTELERRTGALEGQLKESQRGGEELTKKLQTSERGRSAAEDKLRAVEPRIATEVARADGVTKERDALFRKAEQLTKDLESERTLAAARLEELKEEQRRRTELLQDIAFIRSQVADLSSTKGALMARLDSMANREAKRQVATSEMTNLLRDAEVMAADRAASARKMQGRAEKFEHDLAEAQRRLAAQDEELDGLRAAAAQAAALQQERDQLQIQIQFFQRQLGAMQRAKAPPHPPVGTVPAPKVTGAQIPPRPAALTPERPGAPAAASRANMPQYQPPTQPVLATGDRERTETALPALDLPSEWQPIATVRTPSVDITQPGEALPSFPSGIARTEPEIPVPKPHPGGKAKR